MAFEGTISACNSFTKKLFDIKRDAAKKLKYTDSPLHKKHLPLNLKFKPLMKKSLRFNLILLYLNDNNHLFTSLKQKREHGKYTFQKSVDYQRRGVGNECLQKTRKQRHRERCS